MAKGNAASTAVEREVAAAAASINAQAARADDDPLSRLNSPCAEYDAVEDQRALCLDLVEGLPAIRRNASVRLPRGPMEKPVKNPNDSTDVYDPWLVRVANARYNSTFRDAARSVADSIFASEARFADETPPALDKLQDDVDGEGNSFHVFALTAGRAAVATGADFVLVDYPNADPRDVVTEADEKLYGLRPRWRRYPSETVIDARDERVLGRTRYSYVRVRERMRSPTAEGREFESSWIDAVRVMRSAPLVDPASRALAMREDPGDPRLWASWQLFAKLPRESDGRLRWTKVGEGLYVNQIDLPFVLIPTDPVAREWARPLLIDLAEATIVYMRKLSSLDNAQAAVGHPLTYWEGATKQLVQEQQVTFQRLLYGPTGSRLGFVEPSGASWGAIENTLDRLRADMLAMAQSPYMTRQSGTLTATGEAIRGAKAATTIQALSIMWADAWSMVLFYSALYLKLVEPEADEGWGGVKLNDRFMPPTMQADALQTANERNLSGKLSDATMWEILQAFDAVPDYLTWDQERERIDEEGVSGEILPDMNVKIAPPAGEGEPDPADAGEGDEPVEPAGDGAGAKEN